MRHRRPPTTATTDRPSLFTPAFRRLSAASLAYFTAAGMLLPALPRHVAGPLGGSDLAVGIVFGAFSVTAVVARPLAGVLGDRRGRRPLLVLGALLFGLSVLAYGATSSVAVLTGLRLLGGAGEALFFVGMVTTFTDLAPPERRGEAMSLASLALYLGIGGGPVLADAIATRLGLGAVWLTAGAVALSAAAMTAAVPETRPSVPDVPSGAARGIRRVIHPLGLLPGVVLLAGIVGMAGFLAFAPLHVLDAGLGSAGPVLLTFAGVVVVIRALGARLPDLLGPGRAIRLALLASVVGLGCLGWWHAPLGVFLGAGVLGVGVALLTPSVFALAAQAAPVAERSQVMATTSAFIDIAFGVGPVVMGFLAASAGRPAAFVGGAIIAAAGLLVVGLTRLGSPEGRPRRTAPVSAAPVPEGTTP